MQLKETQNGTFSGSNTQRCNTNLFTSFRRTGHLKTSQDPCLTNRSKSMKKMDASIFDIDMKEYM